MAHNANGPGTRPEYPDGDEVEHDQRVGARLAELAGERGMTVHEVLQALNAALSSGQPLANGNDGAEDEWVSAGLPSSRKGARVIRQRPADAIWGVTSLEYQGPPVAQRSPCASTERCPWRQDATPGIFPAEAFRLSAPTSYPDSDRLFGCHSSTPEAPRVCAGWLLRGAAGNRQVQEMLKSGHLDKPIVPDGVELYDDYAEMAMANGVAEDDPALVPLRQGQAQGQGADDEFASLLVVCREKVRRSAVRTVSGIWRR